MWVWLLINIYQDGTFENVLANSQYSSFLPSLYFEKLPTQKVKEEYNEHPRTLNQDSSVSISPHLYLLVSLFHPVWCMFVCCDFKHTNVYQHFHWMI